MQIELKNKYGNITISNKALNNIAENAIRKIKDIEIPNNDNHIVSNFKNGILSYNIKLKIKPTVDVNKLCINIQNKINDVINGMLGINCKKIDIEIIEFIK